MPDSVPDISASALIHERQMRLYKRRITGIATIAKQAAEDRRNIPLFKVKLSSAEADWEGYHKAWMDRDALQVLAADPDSWPDKNAQDEYDKLRNELDEAKTLLIQTEEEISRASIRPQSVSRFPPNESTVHHSFADQSLPRISLPSYAGDLLEWSCFKDSFMSMVHEEPSLSNIKKFHYLRAALRGEAATLISRIPVTESSYKLAWDKLMSTYNNERILASAYVKRILECDAKSKRSETERYETFLKEVADGVEGFRSLGLEDKTDFLLSTLALRALDSSTRNHLELSLKSLNRAPTVDEVIDFVRRRLNAMKLSRDFYPADMSTKTPSSPSRTDNRWPRRTARRYNNVTLHTSTRGIPRRSPLGQKTDRTPTSRSHQSPNKSCAYCKGNHILPYCPTFSSLTSRERIEFIQGWKGCSNCLREGHSISHCASKWSCRFCKKKHHSLIHSNEDSRNKVQTSENASTHVGAAFSSSCNHTSSKGQVLLSTAQVLIEDNNQMLHSARALLDCGSTCTIISSSLAKKLQLATRRISNGLKGLGGANIGESSASVKCTLRPHHGSQPIITEALIMEKICQDIPSKKLDKAVFLKLSILDLADKSFDTPGPVDILIGADIYTSIIIGAPTQSEIPNLSLVPTIFGLAVMGEVVGHPTEHKSTFLTTSSLDEQLKQFWELEEPAPVDRSHPDDTFCETFFKQTHSRTPEGRYVVRLPVKPGSDLPDPNRSLATRRFFLLERKLSKDTVLSESYRNFMQEYQDLGHMTLTECESPYLIPHHGIWQNSKLRVVFDGSCSVPGGKSLNDVLLSGPKLQKDISTVLMNFRTHSVPLVADLTKMYRQILVHEEDRPLQHILWRSEPQSPLREFSLNTVTYGERPSSFLAMRVIKQLVEDEGSKYPLAAERVTRDMYVDDIVTGADSLEEAAILKEELCALFAKGGFTLSKWASTVDALCPPSEKKSAQFSIKPNSSGETVKILGLVWEPDGDIFSYNIQSPQHLGATKRRVLSCIAKIFDPLGFLSPVTFLAKNLMQEVWKEKLKWDDPLTGRLLDAWKQLADEWHYLSSIAIPRHVFFPSANCQLIGFCDASNKGYAAAVYLKAYGPSGVKISLLKAKTKVAPITFESIARLELCGALLLSRLVQSIDIPGIDSRQTWCFTDSTNVLAWLNLPPYSLGTFQANRVSQILKYTSINRWRHVRSEDNPCDIASRGCEPSKMSGMDLWWNGPPWIRLPESHWPLTNPADRAVLAVREVQKVKYDISWMQRYSSFRSLVFAMACFLRIKETLLRKKHCTQQLPASRNISPEEYKNAQMRCIYLVQRALLPDDLFSSSSSTPNEYRQLTPFLDERGIIRVGGRLQNSPLSYSSKHPILIPAGSHLAELIVDDIHHRYFHAGATLLLSLLRTNYWIPRAGKLIRGRISRCITCRRTKAKPTVPLMAPLPSSRFTEYKAFRQVGVDYAGPFMIKESSRRKAALGKAYLCIFVCLSSKAVHLETVSALTTAAFLAAFERFSSRRGLPNSVSSDNGTNFVGAARYIKDIFAFLAKEEDTLKKYFAPLGVEWNFTPPRAPHFGGIWEAGVKSVKSLLVSTIAKQPYTFEELCTAFVKIEGILNSRPLCALKADPEDFSFLTPGHFLNGAPLAILPQLSETSEPIHHSLRSRWLAVEAQIANVWKRWRRDYLHSLQQRKKWTHNTRNLSVGDLVILLEKRSLVGHWPVARVTKVFPGRDGAVRVVEIRTPSGNSFTRAVSSLIPFYDDPGN